MTANYNLVEDENKYFGGDYAICDQCEWNGVPNQRIVVVYLGIRPANEPGFIYKFETYDCSQDGNKDIHRHKYDPTIIDHRIDQIFGRTERSAD